MYYRISDAICSVCNVDDVEKATKLLAQTTLRNMLGTRTLAGILSEREVVPLYWDLFGDLLSCLGWNTNVKPPLKG